MELTEAQYRLIEDCLPRQRGNVSLSNLQVLNAIHDAPGGRKLLTRLGWAVAMYQRRNEIERLFRRLKGFRRIFSRFEKLDVVFLAFIHFALVVKSLR